jgi:hypothetical protein
MTMGNATIPTCQALYHALKVVVETAHITEYLEAHDPKALEQAQTAVRLAETRDGKEEERARIHADWNAGKR